MMMVKKRCIKHHMISSSRIKNPTMIIFRISSKENHKGLQGTTAGYGGSKATAAARYSGRKEKATGNGNMVMAKDLLIVHHSSQVLDPFSFSGDLMR
ncbi:hypothetical protein L3X38_024069 [Prunus dulcis]|uniref:Uncharacterized protein n=1 Tax=Prunus dulcis TaxID=3755 RepID=A0AAD4Z536_PRUDU|nr:hypothetical protein L3X38_024069 [Prunus dulcis]